MNFSALGDRAVLIQVGSTIDEATHRRVRAIHARLVEHPIPGVVDLVPAYVSIAVHYDPVRLPPAQPSDALMGPHARLQALLTQVVERLDPDQAPVDRTVDIAVAYGAEFGPDLEYVAQQHGLSVDDVIRVHTNGDYLVYMIGFAPGFPYLGGLDPRLATPRRGIPRTVVPAGSVGIGGSQTGVYPIATPGGWHLIGRTPQRLFAVDREPPTLLRAGDRVRFRQVSAAEFASISAEENAAAAKIEARIAPQ